jgi:hypothetical protein
MRFNHRVRLLFLPLLFFLYVPAVSAFWVVNFGPAQTLEKGQFAMVAGTGGQYVAVGDPTTDNSIFFIPHAGIRYGFTEWMDAGYRLAPLPLPFTAEAPPLGGNLDAKFFFGDREAKWKFSTLVGAGIAHVQVFNEHRMAYSPNTAALITRSFDNGVDFTTMLRYVWLGIPSAPGGAEDNRVSIAGVSWGLKIPLGERLSLLPEIGAYHYNGRLRGEAADGFAVQYGIVLATSF